jgi:hypothetical protein
MDIIVVINVFALITLIVFIVIYCIDIKVPYPKLIVYIISEPILRFTVYLAIYALSLYNPILSLYLLIATLLIHLDYVNLMTISDEKS